MYSADYISHFIENDSAAHPNTRLVDPTIKFVHAEILVRARYEPAAAYESTGSWIVWPTGMLFASTPLALATSGYLLALP